MAPVHNQLSRYTDLSKGVRNALGLAEGGLERVSESLQATMPLFQQPEWAYPRGELWGTCRVLVSAGGAGTQAMWGVGLAPGSKALAVLEAGSLVHEGAGGAGAVWLYGATYATFIATLAAAGDVMHMDTRSWFTGAPNVKALPVVPRAGTPVAAFGTLCQAIFTLTSRGALAHPIVISPGWAAVFVTSQANVDLHVSPLVRYRGSQPGELEGNAF